MIEAPLIPSVVTKISLGQQIAKGAIFMVALRVAFRFLGLLSSLILLRLLVPSDFGIVGLAMAALSILEVLSDLSFQAGIIRMPKPRRVHYDTAWTLGILRGVAMAILVVAMSPLLAKMVGDPRVVQLSFALAAISVLQGFENIGVVDFQRHFEFDRYFRYQVFGKLAGVCVCVPAAFLSHSYWALIAGIAATRLSTAAASFVVSDYRPRLSLAAWRDLFNFSKWLLVSNVQWMIDANIMTFMTGYVAGASSIGLYQVANQVASLPASEVAAPIRQPMYAGLSRAADDMPELRRQTLDGLFMTLALVAPMSIGISLMASPIVDLFFGWKWIAAIPLVHLCALYALCDAVGHFTHNVYIVTHRQRRFVGIFTVALAVRIPAIVLGAVLYGVYGATVALVVTSVFNMVLWSVNIFPQVGISFRDIARGTWRTVFGVLVMAVAVIWLSDLWPEPQALPAGLLRCAVICVIGAAIHIASQLAAWRVSGEPPGAERHILKSARVIAVRLGLVASKRVPA
jgi:O-antigen/teichoic acid export membrane protein